MTTGLVLGIDPDTHSTAWAVLNPDGRIQDCGIWKVPKKIAGRSIVGGEAVQLMNARIERELKKMLWVVSATVVETQQYLDKGSQVKVKSLLNLALVSGAIEGLCRSILRVPVHLADPAVWTKGWKKELRHNRLRELTYGITDEGLAEQFGFNRGDAKHVWDAVGLALWWLKEIN